MESLSQTHGMVEKRQTEPTTLAQIWGDDGLARYGTLDAKEYETRLDAYGKTDLMAHAQKMGLIPIDNTKMLKERLLTEFNRYASTFNKPASDPTKDPDLNADVRKILEEGR